MVRYPPSPSIALEPAIRELKAGVENAPCLRILSDPSRILLAIECFSMASKPQSSDCLAYLPAFLELFIEGPFHDIFSTLCSFIPSS